MTALADVRMREIADGVFWLGGCSKAKSLAGDEMHVHSNAFLIRGDARSVMVDTGNPRDWEEIELALDTILGDCPLDWVIPTHPEIPHAGNLGRLLRRYPEARVAGDLRDYHLFYPDLVSRFVSCDTGDTLDLGGGYGFVFLPAPLVDLPSTQWGYEPRERVLFSADGLCWTHHPPLDDDPVHRPGECDLLSSELPVQPTIEQAAYLIRAALWWMRFVDVQPLFDEVDELLERYPARLIAPGHGNVIDDLPELMPLMRRAHAMAYQGLLQLPQR